MKDFFCVSREPMNVAYIHCEIAGIIFQHFLPTSLIKSGLFYVTLQAIFEYILCFRESWSSYVSPIHRLNAAFCYSKVRQHYQQNDAFFKGLEERDYISKLGC